MALNLRSKYDWVLFDADDTLFSFNSFLALKNTFSKFEVVFYQSDYQQYEETNAALWQRYQRSEVSAHDLQIERFQYWGKKLNVDPQTLNTHYLDSLLENSVPLTGAEQLLTFLKDRVRIGLITNGFKHIQQRRLDRTGFQDFFSLLVISEEVGVAKPDRRIFGHALERMGNPETGRVLMVGDNLHTDIIGGNSIGFDTCWVNANNKALHKEIKPKYQVTSLIEVQKIFR